MRRRVELVAPARIEQSGATSDEQLIAMWLHPNRLPSKHTRAAYAADLGWWRDELGALDLRALRLVDVQRVLTANDLAPATLARRIASLRSLLSFGHRVGYLPINLGAVMRAPRVRLDLAERILEPDDVMRLVLAARKGANADRDHLAIRVLYVSGARVSELVALDWRHVHHRDGAAVLTLHGKGDKTRHVWVTAATARELAQARAELGDVAHVEARPLFCSRTARRLAARDVQRIVERAARRAGLPATISPHWLRHAHATHAIERGAPAHVVAHDLGHASLATTTRYTHTRPNSGSARWLDL